VLAARNADSAAAFDALSAYAGLGLGRNWHGDTTLAQYARTPRFATVLQTLYENAQSRSGSRVIATIADSTFWPEGVGYSPASRSYFVASVRHRTIAEVSVDRRTRYLWLANRAGTGAILGVRVDTLRGVLWATTSGIRQSEGYVPSDSTIGALLRIRIADGAIERRWDVPPIPGGHVFGDLAIGPNGDVYFTDSNAPVLYRLRPSADTLEHFSDPLFYNLQGLAPTPDGRTLYLSDYAHGMLRVDLATRQVMRLADAPGSTSLGCDGIAWDRGTIIAVQNGVQPSRIVRFVLDRTGERIVRLDVVDQNLADGAEPTIGTVVGRDFVYVGNSLWDETGEYGRVKPGAHVTRPRLVAAPIPEPR
jgi:sugar lactone lactonase YvrE